MVLQGRVTPQETEISANQMGLLVSWLEGRTTDRLGGGFVQGKATNSGGPSQVAKG